jgi:hypothetical protein
MGPPSADDGDRSEETKDESGFGVDASEGSLWLLLSADAEVSQNARKPSSCLVRARARVVLCSPKMDGASTCG